MSLQALQVVGEGQHVSLTGSGWACGGHVKTVSGLNGKQECEVCKRINTVVRGATCTAIVTPQSCQAPGASAKIRPVGLFRCDKMWTDSKRVVSTFFEQAPARVCCVYRQHNSVRTPTADSASYLDGTGVHRDGRCEVPCSRED